MTGRRRSRASIARVAASSISPSDCPRRIPVPASSENTTVTTRQAASGPASRGATRRVRMVADSAIATTLSPTNTSVPV